MKVDILKALFNIGQLDRIVASVKIHEVIKLSYVFQQFWFHMAICKIWKSDWTQKSQQ